MEKLYIIDASGYIYRSYFAIRNLTNTKGESTNALYGFIRSVLKLINDFHPTHLVSVFDGPRNIIRRTEIYADYKIHRKEMPGDLLHQIHWAQKFCALIGIPLLSIPEVEADDTMGSIAQWAANQGSTVYLCTSDKDMCQLVHDTIFCLNTHKDNLLVDADEVKKIFGVTPQQMVDYLAITGDASDNVPGLPGFGPKTAADLLQAFGSLDYILDHPEEVPGKKKQETIIEQREQALLSRQLITINCSVPIPEDSSFYELKPQPTGPLKEFYAEMNFSSLIRELGSSSSESREEVTYQLIDDEKSLDELVAHLSTFSEICIDTETTNIQPIQAKLVGIGLGVEPKNAWYIPVNGKIGLEQVLKKLKPLLKNPLIGFYGHNIKYDYHVLVNHGIKISTICFDTLVASYLLNAQSKQHSLDHLSLELFNKIKTPIQDLIGKGKNQLCMSDVPIDKVSAYCCEDVDYTIRLKNHLAPKLDERGLKTLFTDLELPLLLVLADMERTGIFVDRALLKQISKKIGLELTTLEHQIYELAGEEFNINSPKQLSHILFDKMGIKPPKKTATGLSTNADVLESLKSQHPLAGKILEYRTLEKLRSTYIDSLPEDVNPETGRIHCTFNQSVAATGRLSCQNPNLQNIPVRTEPGKSIREAFRPEKEGWSYLSADYSQIELRLLAHLSDDPTLINAFNNNEDIHRYTASLILDIPLEEVTSEQRHQAKAINFGIVYGQQAFGLAQELGIESKVAAAFIEAYFARYPKVKSFLTTCKEIAHQTGKAVVPYSGRERPLPEINSKNGMIRSAAERLAVNTPLQGMSADLIKIAMLQIHKELIDQNIPAKMILQIHDELLFELPDSEIPAVEKLVKKTMEGVMQLKVPLIVDIHVGKNWKEC